MTVTEIYTSTVKRKKAPICVLHSTPICKCDGGGRRFRSPTDCSDLQHFCSDLHCGWRKREEGRRRWSFEEEGGGDGGDLRKKRVCVEMKRKKRVGDGEDLRW
ncbi:protein trichome berefringence-like 7 [Sesbania bispinosa]|nr:protein trichome berefringence-like 7 [Sesbania bispinosa]